MTDRKRSSLVISLSFLPLSDSRLSSSSFFSFSGALSLSDLSRSGFCLFCSCHMEYSMSVAHLGLALSPSILVLVCCYVLFSSSPFTFTFSSICSSCHMEYDLAVAHLPSCGTGQQTHVPTYDWSKAQGRKRKTKRRRRRRRY